MKTISAIGLAVVDHVIAVDGFKEAEGSYHCGSYHSDGGGMAATAMCAASRLGSKARLFARIGDDLNGKFILEGLKRFGVDTSDFIIIKGVNSFVSIVMVDTGTGEKQFFATKQQAVLEDKIEIDTSLLKGSDVLLVDGYWMEAALEGAEWANNNGIPVVGDFKGNYEGLDSLLPKVDYLIIPLFFARELTGTVEISDVLEKLKPMIRGIPVVTDGVNGGYYSENGQLKTYRTFKVKSVDSTGAGDAFHGAFCHFLAEGYPLERCLEMSSATGALNCRAFGGRDALPDMNELTDFISKNGMEHN